MSPAARAPPPRGAPTTAAWRDSQPLRRCPPRRTRPAAAPVPSQCRSRGTRRPAPAPPLPPQTRAATCTADAKARATHPPPTCSRLLVWPRTRRQPPGAPPLQAAPRAGRCLDRGPPGLPRRAAACPEHAQAGSSGNRGTPRGPFQRARRPRAPPAGRRSARARGGACRSTRSRMAGRRLGVWPPRLSGGRARAALEPRRQRRTPPYPTLTLAIRPALAQRRALRRPRARGPPHRQRQTPVLRTRRGQLRRQRPRPQRRQGPHPALEGLASRAHRLSQHCRAGAGQQAVRGAPAMAARKRRRRAAAGRQAVRGWRGPLRPPCLLPVQGMRSRPASASRMPLCGTATPPVLRGRAGAGWPPRCQRRRRHTRAGLRCGRSRPPRAPPMRAAQATARVQSLAAHATGRWPPAAAHAP